MCGMRLGVSTRAIRTHSPGDPRPWRDKPEPAPVKFEVGHWAKVKDGRKNSSQSFWNDEMVEMIGRAFRVDWVSDCGKSILLGRWSFGPDNLTPAPEPEQAEKGIAEMISEGFHGRITGMTPYEPPTEYEYHLHAIIEWPDGRRFEGAYPSGLGWENHSTKIFDGQTENASREINAITRGVASGMKGSESHLAILEPGWDKCMSVIYRRPVQAPERYEVNSAVEFLGSP
ncbi:MAG: hypothetical protein ACYS76_09610 [Planctomycetota bacterium]